MTTVDFSGKAMLAQIAADGRAAAEDRGNRIDRETGREIAGKHETPLTVVTNSRGRSFVVRYLPAGAAYGRGNVLVNDGRPMVEFYDVSHADDTNGDYPDYPTPRVHGFGPLGQFVSRYHVDTLLGENEHGASMGGLDLHGDVSAWEIDADTMLRVRAWVRTTREDVAPVTAPFGVNAPTGRPYTATDAMRGALAGYETAVAALGAIYERQDEDPSVLTSNAFYDAKDRAENAADTLATVVRMLLAESALHCDDEDPEHVHDDDRCCECGGDHCCGSTRCPVVVGTGTIVDHAHVPDDDPEPGDRCKVCGADLTWIGPGPYDWQRVDEQSIDPLDDLPAPGYFPTAAIPIPSAEHAAAHPETYGGDDWPVLPHEGCRVESGECVDRNCHDDGTPADPPRLSDTAAMDRLLTEWHAHDDGWNGGDAVDFVGDLLTATGRNTGEES